jgi:hypothetical protein
MESIRGFNTTIESWNTIYKAIVAECVKQIEYHRPEDGMIKQLNSFDAKVKEAVTQYETIVFRLKEILKYFEGFPKEFSGSYNIDLRKVIAEAKLNGKLKKKRGGCTVM